MGNSFAISKVSKTHHRGPPSQSAHDVLERVLGRRTMCFQSLAKVLTDAGWNNGKPVRVEKLLRRLTYVNLGHGLWGGQTKQGFRDLRNYISRTHGRGAIAASGLRNFARVGHKIMSFIHPNNPQEAVIVMGNRYEEDQSVKYGFSLCGVVIFHSAKVSNSPTGQGFHLNHQSIRKRFFDFAKARPSNGWSWSQEDASPMPDGAAAQGYFGNSARDVDQVFFTTGPAKSFLFSEFDLPEYLTVSAAAHYQRYV